MAKPTVEALGIDVAAQSWQRSGEGDGSIEIAFVRDAVRAGGDWVLMRVAGDQARGHGQRVDGGMCWPVWAFGRNWRRRLPPRSSRN